MNQKDTDQAEFGRGCGMSQTFTTIVIICIIFDFRTAVYSETNSEAHTGHEARIP